MKKLLGMVLSALALCVSAKDTWFQPAAGGTDKWSEAANWGLGLPEDGDGVVLSASARSITVDVENARLTELKGDENYTLAVKSDGKPTTLVVEKLTLPRAQAFIAPDANMTIVVRKIDANGTIRNMGAGRILVDRPISAGDLDSVYQANGGGSIVFAGANTAAWAAGPVVHLDASDETAFVYKDAGDPSSGVVRWNGVDGAGYAYHDLAVAPDGTQILPQRVENVVNGLPVVDFGNWVNIAFQDQNNRALGGYLILQCGLSKDLNIYTAFIVETAQAFVFNAQDAGWANIIHGSDAWNGQIVVPRNETHLDFCPEGQVWNGGTGTGLGLMHLNGNAVVPWQAQRSGKDVYDTIGMRAETRPLHIGRLCYDRTYRTGGAKIAEVILYDRKLTDAEFEATENYLRRKWQNADVTVVVPEVVNAVPQLINAGAKPFEIAEGAVVKAETINVVGETSARRGFTGGGTLRVERAAGELEKTAEAAVEIGHGTLEPIQATATYAAPAANPIHDTYFHVDATVDESFTLDANGGVLEWRDVTGNGRAALHLPTVGAVTTLPPRRVPALLNGKPGVDFGAYNSGMCLPWNHTNTTMRTVFAVYGTIANDLSFFIGNMKIDNGPLDCSMHRGLQGTMFYSIYTSAAITQGDVRVNGRPVSWSGHYMEQGPSVVMLAASKESDVMCGSAFAVDRLGSGLGRTGGQQLCEVVVYDRVLDAEEKASVQNWLMAKWLPKTPAGYALQAGEEQFEEIRSVAKAGETAAVKVDEGNVRVGALSGSALTKTGEGTLTVGSVAGLTGALAVEAGTVEIAARELAADYLPPEGYETSGAVAIDVRAVFAVYDLTTAMTVPTYFQATDANDVTRVDGVRGTTLPSGRHVASVISTTRRATWNINTSDAALKELLVYRRAVTDLERRDIEAYLARKWNVGALPGYTGAPQHLVGLVAQGGTVKAAGGLVVDSVSGSGTTTLAGDVTVVDASGLTGAIKVGADASLALTSKVGITEDGVPTEGLIARFDMSHREKLTTVEENGKTYVTRWEDMTGNHVATAVGANRPWILPGDCNGLDVLCTGPYAGYGAAGWEETKKKTGFMDWDNKSIKARTVVEVIGVQEGGNFIVTALPGRPCLHRGGGTGGSYADALIAVRGETTDGGLDRPGAYFAINGQRVVPNTTGFPSPDYHSVAVRVDPDFEYQGEQTYFYVGQFGQDRTWRWGGQRICEFIAYDRVLSDDELAKLDAYLQRKWFNRPAGYAAPAAGNLEVAGGTVDLGGDARVFTSVSGSGTITGGQLNVTDSIAPNGLSIDGVLNFAAAGGEIVLPRTPKKGELIELCSAAGISGDWKSWTVSPLPSENARAHLRVQNGKLYAQIGGAPFIIIIR